MLCPERSGNIHTLSPTDATLIVGHLNTNYSNRWMERGETIQWPPQMDERYQKNVGQARAHKIKIPPTSNSEIFIAVVKKS